MHQLHSGTVTFLFTDIEGSTKLWQHFPGQMPDAFELHHAILRKAIEANGGYVFKTIGDAFCAAFATATDGLVAALAAQRMLRDATWGETGAIRVRMALYTGTVEVRAGEYLGLTLSRVARLLSAGHGGQVLISDSTRVLVQNGLPENVTLHDLGEHRLKDLQRPEHIYQLVVPDLPTEFPPLKTLEAFSNNLPIQLTSFIGREREMAELKQIVQTARLVTLTGAGGSGKTRLAVQTATTLLENFKDGVWFVELAPLTDSALVPSSVASVFGVREQQGLCVLDLLTDYLRPKQLILILDNAEHLVDACAQFADGLLHATLHVHLLVTSREALGIAGEQIYPVPSLQVPDSRETFSVETLAPLESVRLFVERAMAVQPRFDLTSANAPYVAQICRRLDGIPLAIELAASRVQALSVEQVAKRLDDAFLLLTGGSRTALPRQQTLRALIDWSYDLLSEHERTLMCRLSVFSGGWTLEASEEVCAGDGIEKEDVCDLQMRLAAKSIILQEKYGGETRYRYLETIREYAREKLIEVGEEKQVRSRHVEFFLKIAEEADPKLASAAQEIWLDRLETEHDNLRTGIEWLTQREDAEMGLRLAGALWRFWETRGYLVEGLERLTALLNLPNSSTHPKTRLKALYAAGVLADAQNNYRLARLLFEEHLAINRELGDHWGIASSLNNLGIIALRQSDYAAARSLYTEVLNIWRETKYQPNIALTLNNLGNVANLQADYVMARAWHEESLNIFRALRDQHGVAWSLNHLGDVARNQHDFEAAEACYAESLTIFKELGHKSDIARSLVDLGNLACDRNDYASARALYIEGITIYVDLGDRRGIAHLLERLAKLAVALHQYERALHLTGAAASLREALGVPLSSQENTNLEHCLTGGRQFLGEEASNAAWKHGTTMSLEQAVAYAVEENP